MYTFLLVDADAKSREKLSQQIRKVEAHCNILEASSTEEALRCFITQKPNLIFLDADLPGKSGFDFIHELTQVGEQPRVVMVAQHQRYAIQAIRASVVDYLLKPVEETDIRICLKRLYALEEEELERENMTELLIRLKQNHRLRVNSRVGFEIIKPEEILYCEADGNYTRICMLDNRKLTTSTTLGLVESQLPRELFFRISRSILVNLNYLKAVNRKERICVLKNGDIEKELPMAQNRLHELAEMF